MAVGETWRARSSSGADETYGISWSSWDTILRPARLLCSLAASSCLSLWKHRKRWSGFTVLGTVHSIPGECSGCTGVSVAEHLGEDNLLKCAESEGMVKRPSCE